MRQLSQALADHLSSRATTLCSAWRLIRSDGEKIGFTDHDRAVLFDGLTHHPETGMDASDARAHAGLKVGGLEVTGILSSDRISETDLRAGHYDGARVETWLVNWSEPAQRHLMHVGEIGEVRLADTVFTAEIRSLTHRLNQEQGRFYRCLCDANLGDDRCRVDLDQAEWHQDGVIDEARDDMTMVISGLAGQATSFFDQGIARFRSGRNRSVKLQIRSHKRIDADRADITLWQPPPETIRPGDRLRLTTGCDKQFETCRVKFGNSINFQGFPHIPGNDFSLSVAKRAGSNSGGPLR